MILVGKDVIIKTVLMVTQFHMMVPFILSVHLVILVISTSQDFPGMFVENQVLSVISVAENLKQRDTEATT